MKKSLTSQQNACSRVRVDANASARKGTENAALVPGTKHPALHLGLYCLVDTYCVFLSSNITNWLSSMPLLVLVVDVHLQGGEVGLRVGRLSTGGSLWHHLMCRLVGTHTCTCTFMTLIFTFMSWCFVRGPPTSSWTPLSLLHTHTRTHMLDPRLPPFYTKLPLFHAWCPGKWMT